MSILKVRYVNGTKKGFGGNSRQFSKFYGTQRRVQTLVASYCSTLQDLIDLHRPNLHKYFFYLNARLLGYSAV